MCEPRHILIWKFYPAIWNAQKKWEISFSYNYCKVFTEIWLYLLETNYNWDLIHKLIKKDYVELKYELIRNNLSNWREIIIERLLRLEFDLPTFHLVLPTSQCPLILAAFTYVLIIS